MGTYEQRYWLNDTWGMNRSERQSGTYHPYIPTMLMEQDIVLTASASQAVAQAQADISLLNERVQHLMGTEPLARLILRSEAMASSKIEGLTMNAGKLLEYEALEELGVPHRLDRNEAAILANISSMQEGIIEAARERTITVETICDVNKRLLEHTDMASYGGVLRTTQNWIGGNNVNPIGAAFVPPVPERVPLLMEDLVSFINTSELPAVAIAAIAHAQLETIHPFADGNGRTGRTLIHIIVKRRGVATRTIPPVSLVLATDKDRYIANLSAYRTDEDDPTSDSFVVAANDWIEYFARAVSLSCDRASAFEQRLSAIEDSWRSTLRPRAHSAADILLDKLVDNPVVSINSAKRLTGRSYEAARNAVASLEAAGILVQNARNRKSGIYVAPDVLNAFTLYERALATPGGDTAHGKPQRPVPQRPPR